LNEIPIATIGLQRKSSTIAAMIPPEQLGPPGLKEKKEELKYGLYN